MGLEGYLEDLGVSEILQIVSLSKKSGTLFLTDDAEAGSITFLQGQVVRATSSQYSQTLGQLLKKHKLVTDEQVDAALVYQDKLETHQPFGAILSKICGLDEEKIEEVVGQQIETIVSSFFTWRKGTFTFQLGKPQTFGSAALNPFDFMLAQGISPQRLVAKGQHFVRQKSDDPAVDEGELAAEIQELDSRPDDQDLQLLRGMLAELENPYIGGGIIMLILRYASEIMNRAIIFDVRGRQLVGLGQFGLTSSSSSADEIVRRLRLQVEKKSIFGRVIDDKCSMISALGDETSERTLMELLGGVPEKVFLTPLISDGKVVAMLYGDNYPDNRPYRSTRAFELFLSKAGIVMEHALQEPGTMVGGGPAEVG